MQKSAIILIVIIIILLLGNVFLGLEYFSAQSRLKPLLADNQSNARILNFEKLFINKVLNSQGQVAYADRLRLENAVLETKDSEIIDAWHKFLDSQTEVDAQQTVLKLLVLFSTKLKY